MGKNIYEDVEAGTKPSELYDAWKRSADSNRFDKVCQHWPQDMRDRVLFLTGILAKAQVLNLTEVSDADADAAGQVSAPTFDPSDPPSGSVMLARALREACENLRAQVLGQLWENGLPPEVAEALDRVERLMPTLY